MFSKTFAKCKKIALHQEFDHLNSPRVPCNGCQVATKNTKPKNRGAKKMNQELHLKTHLPSKNLFQSCPPLYD
jgi:hypothetical protein